MPPEVQPHSAFVLAENPVDAQLADADPFRLRNGVGERQPAARYRDVLGNTGVICVNLRPVVTVARPHERLSPGGGRRSTGADEVRFSACVALWIRRPSGVLAFTRSEIRIW